MEVKTELTEHENGQSFSEESNMALVILSENVHVVQTLTRHTSDVTCCDFAPNFTLITGSSDKTVRVWKWVPQSGYEENSYSPLRGHKYGVTCVRVSPQGSMLVSTSIDGTAVLWNLHAGTKIHTMVQMNGDAIRVCRFAPDSSVLVTAGDNGAICIWDLVHRSLTRTIFHHEGTTQALAFTPDSQYLISACSLEVISVWSMQDILETAGEDSCSSLAVIDNAHDLGILCMDISPVILNNEEDPLVKQYTLATSGNSHDIKMWTLLTRVKPKYCSSQNLVSVENTNSLIGHKSAVTCIKYHSTGAYLISCGLDKYIKIWDHNGGCITTMKTHTRYVNCVSFSRDGGLAVSGSNDKTVIVWGLTEDISVDSKLVKPFALLANALNNLQEMQVVKNAESSETFELVEKIDDIFESAINSCHFYGNHLLAVGSSDKLVKLFKVDENNAIEETDSSPLDGHSYSVNHVEFSKDGSRLATCSLDGCTIIWDPNTGEKTMELVESSLAIRNCRFSPDGKHLITSGDDENANTWDLETGELIATFEGHSDAVTSGCFSPDGKIMATTCHNSDFRLWTVEAVNIHIQDDAHDLGIQNSDFSENLEPIPLLTMNNKQHYLLATCGNDSLVKLWRICIPKEDDEYAFSNVEVKLWRTLQGHGGSVTCVRLSPESGEIACSTATDRQARLWSVYSAECLHVLDHDSIVTSCSFTYDTSLLAIGCLDKTLWIWKLPQQLVVRSMLLNKVTAYRRKLIVNWSTEDVLKWLHEIEFTSIVPNVINLALNGQKILTLEVEQICSGMGLDDEQEERFAKELKWLKLDELQHPNVSDNQPGEVPPEYLCPITQEIMREPVRCSDGFVYEKQAINEWFMSGKFTSPMTNETLTDINFTMDQEMRNAIHNFLYQDM
uniref:WD repeat, SAM and U-box domain-containing protein 1 n=2 Tax=Photinus pyralis TaxID=7054 RepID=A0A1Y1JZX4_PHOPY